MMQNIAKVVVLLIAYMMTLSECKFISQSIRLSQIRRSNNLFYITKFAMDIGRGEYFAKAVFDSPALGQGENRTVIDIGFSVVVDDQWSSDKSEINCSNLRSRSSVNNRLYLPTNATASNEIKAGLNSRRRRHVWFFVLHDCDNKLSNLFGNKIHLELTILNVDETHYPTDEGNFVWYYFFLFVGFAYIFLKNIFALHEKYRRSDEMDWPLCLIQISAGLWALANLMNFLHWFIYGYNGKGFFIFDLLSQVFSHFSGFVLTVVLILLSWGWTINHLSQDFYDTLIPLSVILGVIQAMIVGLGKLTDDSFTKYHQYDGWAGYTILVLRLGLCVYFAFGIKNTIQVSKEKVKSFIQQLGFFGILYFLTFPILLFISYFIAPYVQHKVMKNGIIILESITLLFLLFLFTSKKTEYYKVSQQGNTILPNFKSN